MRWVLVNAAFLAVGLFGPSIHALDLTTPKKVSLAGQALIHDKAMPTVQHDKDANGGYNKGSPLYKKQEARKKQGVEKAAAKPAASKEDPSVIYLIFALVICIVIAIVSVVFFMRNKSPQQLKKSVLDHHDEVTRHASNSSIHSDSGAFNAYLSSAGPLLCCSAVIYGIIGALALHYSGGSHGTCPYPLTTLLYWYGWIVTMMAVFMLCTIAIPPCFVGQYCAHAACQIISLVMLVFVLISYSHAEQCGKQVWWAALFLSSPLIGVCVYCCCTPFGAAKAAVFLGYKAAVGTAVMKAPSYSAVTTALSMSELA
jgi:hypothetical protein